MGRELACRVKIGRKAGAGKALLESEELLFRGELSLRIALRDIKALRVNDGELVVTYSGGTARFELGDQAAAWAKKIRRPPSLLDKLGVRPGMHVAVMGVENTAFERDVSARTGEAAWSRPRKDTDLIFLAADSTARLDRLPALREMIRPTGGIWVVWPKGRPGLHEDDVREAARRAGLVDVKVAAFSSTHSALKLVIPVAKRR